MGRAIRDLFELLLYALTHSAEYVPRLFSQVLRQSIRFFDVATLPETLLLFVAAALLTILLIFLQAGCHLAISGFKGGRARIFISYEHNQESIARDLATSMLRASVTATVLPFVRNPDHDDLLDEIKTAISRSDVVVCLPGGHPSFVENEVSMAFALNKPLLFVLRADHHARLPNTAKKGYPLFDLDALKRENWLPIVRFVSYLSADVRSTFRLYGTVLNHLKSCAKVIALTYCILIVMATSLIGHSYPTHGPSNADFWAQPVLRRFL
jgi:hypothetical protein